MSCNSNETYILDQQSTIFASAAAEEEYIWHFFVLFFLLRLLTCLKQAQNRASLQFKGTVTTCKTGPDGAYNFHVSMPRCIFWHPNWATDSIRNRILGLLCDFDLSLIVGAKTGVFYKLLIDWDFQSHTDAPQIDREWSPWKNTSSECGLWCGEKYLVKVMGQRSEWEDWLETLEKSQQLKWQPTTLLFKQPSSLHTVLCYGHCCTLINLEIFLIIDLFMIFFLF